MKKKICSLYHYAKFNSYKIIRKGIHNTTKALKPNFMCGLVVMCCVSLNTHFLQSLLKLIFFIIKIPKDFLFILSLYTMSKLSKTTPLPKLFPSDCITLSIRPFIGLSPLKVSVSRIKVAIFKYLYLNRFSLQKCLTFLN